MNVVDSSGWLEYLACGANGDFFAPAIEELEHLIVPSICIYEVFKRINDQRGERDALKAVALMDQGIVVDLSFSLAISAAAIRIERKLPMADRIIMATARYTSAVLWTQDADFEGLDNVRYVAKRAI